MAPGTALIVFTVAVAALEDKPPRLVRFVEPENPAEERAAGTSAIVKLALEVGAEGRVTGVSVLESGGQRFDAAAIVAARQLVYEPAEQAGRTVASHTTIEYGFSLESYRITERIALSGRVIDRATREPISDLTVSVPALGLAVPTDENGRFVLTDIPPGRYAVELSGPVRQVTRFVEAITAAEARVVRYFVD